MSIKTKNLYRVKKKDIKKAGLVLADAFTHDPIWGKLFKDYNIEKRAAFFEGAVRYCLKFGEVYAPSEQLEGIACWLPSEYADMTVWRMLRTSTIISGLRMGMKMGMKIKPVFEPLEEDRKENMNGRKYIYLMVIGISSKHQRQGFGKKILTELLKQADDKRLPIYLETATLNNVKMYEKLGFKEVNKVILPVVNLPQWEMIREYSDK